MKNKKLISWLTGILIFIAAAVLAGIYIFSATHKNAFISVTEEKISEFTFPDHLNYVKSDVYTTPYGTFEPKEHMLEINEYMTLHPNELTAEMSLMYITPDKDKEKAAKIMPEIKTLSDKICQGITDDSKKAYALAMWVGQNVAYDFDASRTLSDLSVTSLEAILNNDFRTTCGGFANLYSALCYTQGIYCLNMKGGTSSDGYTRAELEKAPANHEWNAVYINDNWYYVDCTWITDLSYSNGEISGGNDVKAFYASFGFGEMSIEHRIDRCEHRIYNITDSK